MPTFIAHRTRRAVLAALLLIPGSVLAAAPEDPTNGQVYQGGGPAQVWAASTGEWLSPEAFWESYVAGAEGKYWGRGAEYPPYNDVDEHDTLIIEVEGGPCLMYFFHNRWRRAQDVRRWDPVFNDLLGCPNVFR